MLLACNFTKIITPPWVFFTIFKLYKCYQMAQNTYPEVERNFVLLEILFRD